MYFKAIEESTSLKIRIPNGQSETVNQRTDNTMAKRKRKTNTTTISHTLLKSRIKKIDSALLLKEERRTKVSIHCYW